MHEFSCTCNAVCVHVTCTVVTVHAICEGLDIAESCPDIELNENSLEILERFCYLRDTIHAKRSVFGSVITRIRSGWCKFRYLVTLITSTGLPLGAKSRLYTACVRSVMLYGSETWSVKEDDVILLERNDARMAK